MWRSIGLCHWTHWQQKWRTVYFRLSVRAGLSLVAIAVWVWLGLLHRNWRKLYAIANVQNACIYLLLYVCLSLSLPLTPHLSLCMCKIIILQWHDVKWPTLETWTCSAAPEARPQRNVPLTQPSRVAHAMGLPVVTHPHSAHIPPCGDSKASYLIIIMRTKFMMRIFMYYSQS